ncbi:MAG: polynucleotide adenylyltransferase PcnB [Burkholderiales bacterium]|jgi:poly(A) polymerase|nr:polynucleotide adenylyltransferase PcnB [Burkholderiales bacterium]NBO75533.1 polynucleotide adenylyltransferase PcnB [Betaproteobacteria bacterium]
MIKRFINKLLGKPEHTTASGIPLGRRVELSAQEHGIDPSLVDERAVQVVTTLKNAGFEAYVVGGAVRDLLVGRRPKDFDVATNATPEQVKSLFRRAFIIGRRFRIVHVIHGRGRDHEVIEVSTFRAYLDAAAADQVDGNERTAKGELAGKSHAVDASGRVLRDNVWGPQIEDAARRDFTINALYYDPVTRVVVDYHQGFADVRKRVLRMIGDPASRYREDPVRLLRVVRFTAKLGFEIEKATAKPMKAAAALLASVPASRLFDEMVKLLQTGHALSSIEAIRRFELRGVFPILDVALDHPAGSSAARFVELALADTDRRVGEDKPVAPSFLLACLLWDEVRHRWQALKEDGTPPVPALQSAIDAVFDERIGDISGRGKLAADMREIWLMQPRFERRSGSGPASLVEQVRFRAAFDFLRLRADVDEVPPELAEWWEDYSLGSDEEREALLAAVRSQPGPKRVRSARADSGPAAAASGGRTGRGAPSRSRSSSAQGVADDAGSAADRDGDPSTDGSADASDAPRKRRRRRRRPGGTGGTGGTGDGTPQA